MKDPNASLAGDRKTWCEYLNEMKDMENKYYWAADTEPVNEKKLKDLRDRYVYKKMAKIDELYYAFSAKLHGRTSVINGTNTTTTSLTAAGAVARTALGSGVAVISALWGSVTGINQELLQKASVGDLTKVMDVCRKNKRDEIKNNLGYDIGKYPLSAAVVDLGGLEECGRIAYATSALGQEKIKISVPDRPTAVAATLVTSPTGMAALVAFKAPENNGGSAITEYEVTSHPENKKNNGGSSPIVIDGLKAVPYTFTVTARNAAGTGPTSDDSVPTKPEPSVPPLKTKKGK